MTDKKIDVGYESVIIEKMFGPLIFASLRIRALPKTNTWLIERQIINNNEWVSWAEIPGQLESDFDPEEEENNEME